VTKGATSWAVPYLSGLLLDAGLGLVIPPHARVLLALGLSGGGLDGLRKGRRCDERADRHGYDCCESLH